MPIVSSWTGAFTAVCEICRMRIGSSEFDNKSDFAEWVRQEYDWEISVTRNKCLCKKHKDSENDQEQR